MSLNKKHKYIIYPILFMALIFILSSIPVDKILEWIKHRFSAVMALRLQLQDFFHIRIIYSEIQNYLHVPFFVLLAFLWMKFFDKRRVDFKKAIIYTLVITFIFAGLNEFSQAFIPSRVASFFDLFLDIVGCLAGVAIYRLVKKGLSPLCHCEEP